MGISDKSPGDVISFSDINDELGNDTNATLDLKTAGDSFSGISTDGVYSIGEFYGKSDASPSFSSFTVTPSSTTTGRIDVSWTTSGPVNTFQLRRATSIDGNGDLDTGETLVHSTNNGTYTDTSLSNTGDSNGLYYYQATATNTDPNPNRSTDSNVQSGLLLPTVSSLSVTNPGASNTLNLSWTNQGTITSIQVFRSSNSNMTSPDGGGVYATLGAVSSYSDTSAVAYTTKYYQVKVFNSTGNTLSNIDSGLATSNIDRTIQKQSAWTWDGDSYTAYGWATDELIDAVNNTTQAVVGYSGDGNDLIGPTITNKSLTVNQALGWVNSNTAKDASTLSAFNGSNRFWRNATDSKIHQIATNGVISNTLSFTPGNFTISQVSKTGNSVTLRATGDTRVASTLRFSASNNDTSQVISTQTTTPTTYGSISDSSTTTDYTFTGLAGTTSYKFSVRGENAQANGSYSTGLDVTTNAGLSISSSPSSETIAVVSSTTAIGSGVSNLLTVTISNRAGNTASISRTQNTSGAFQYNYSTSGDPGTSSGFTTVTTTGINSDTIYIRGKFIEDGKNTDEGPTNNVITVTCGAATLNINVSCTSTNTGGGGFP